MTESTTPKAPTKPGRRPILAQVVSTRRLTPHMIRVVLTGDALQGFPVGEFTDHYVKLQFPPAGADYAAPFDVEEIRRSHPKDQWPFTRTYTVRAWDPERTELTVDFVHHGDVGVAGPWAANAQPGDPIQLLGPGGAYRPDPTAEWHLMIGDASVVPAVSASLLQVPAGVPVVVLLEIEGPDEELPLETSGDLRLTWIHRSGRGDDGLAEAVRSLEFLDGRLDAFLHGEAGAVREIRKHLLIDRSVDPKALSVSGYWKRSRTEEGWREDKAEWKQLVEQDVA